MLKVILSGMAIVVVGGWPLTGLAWGQQKDADEPVGAIIVVEVVGSGTTADEAEKNAISNAVQQAVGAMVDAETMIENDEVIKDQILTYSDGYVEKKEVIDPPAMNQQSGLIETRIKAWVRRGDVGKKLKATNIPLTFEGESAWAQSLTKRERSDNAFLLLSNILKGWPYDFLVVQIADHEGRVGSDAMPIIEPAENQPGFTDVKFFIEMSFDREAYYTSFVPKIVKALDNIAERKSELTIIREREGTIKEFESSGALRNPGTGNPMLISIGYGTPKYNSVKSSVLVRRHGNPDLRARSGYRYTDRMEKSLGLEVSLQRDEFAAKENVALYSMPEEDKYGYIRWWVQVQSKKAKSYDLFRCFYPLSICFRDSNSNVVKTVLYELNGYVFLRNIIPRFHIQDYLDISSDLYCEPVTIRLADAELKRVSSVLITFHPPPGTPAMPSDVDLRGTLKYW
jgi:hypothetical protein